MHSPKLTELPDEQALAVKAKRLSAQIDTLLSDSQLINVVAPAFLVKEVEIDPYSRSIE